jgi:hypothetical protein
MVKAWAIFLLSLASIVSASEAADFPKIGRVCTTVTFVSPPGNEASYPAAMVDALNKAFGKKLGELVSLEVPLLSVDPRCNVTLKAVVRPDTVGAQIELEIGEMPLPVQYYPQQVNFNAGLSKENINYIADRLAAPLKILLREQRDKILDQFVPHSFKDVATTVDCPQVFSNKRCAVLPISENPYLPLFASTFSFIAHLKGNFSTTVKSSVGIGACSKSHLIVANETIDPDVTSLGDFGVDQFVLTKFNQDDGLSCENEGLPTEAPQIPNISGPSSGPRESR